MMRIDPKILYSSPSPSTLSVAKRFGLDDFDLHVAPTLQEGKQRPDDRGVPNA
jgi:hypothetical protein